MSLALHDPDKWKDQRWELVEKIEALINAIEAHDKGFRWHLLRCLTSRAGANK